jgi:transcriptional regulator with XRE-family HTH domain
MIDVRKNLKAMIEERGELQKRIALETGRGDSSVSQWLKSKGQPSLRKTLEICEVLDISIVDVFTYPEKYVPESQANPVCEDCKRKDEIIDNLQELLRKYKQDKKK